MSFGELGHKFFNIHSEENYFRDNCWTGKDKLFCFVVCSLLNKFRHSVQDHQRFRNAWTDSNSLPSTNFCCTMRKHHTQTYNHKFIWLSILSGTCDMSAPIADQSCFNVCANIVHLHNIQRAAGGKMKRNFGSEFAKNGCLRPLRNCGWDCCWGPKELIPWRNRPK